MIGVSLKDGVGEDAEEVRHFGQGVALLDMGEATAASALRFDSGFEGYHGDRFHTENIDTITIFRTRQPIARRWSPIEEGRSSRGREGIREGRSRRPPLHCPDGGSWVTMRFLL